MITPQTRRQASQIFNETHSDSDDIGDGIDDMRSPLDRTIDKIGMGMSRSWLLHVNYTDQI
jgi:hypothetical protein